MSLELYAVVGTDAEFVSAPKPETVLTREHADALAIVKTNDSPSFAPYRVVRLVEAE